MSLNKLSCTLAFCAILAAPVMADPSVTVTRNAGLSASGGFVWSVQVDPDETQFDTPADGDNMGVNGASTAIDIGFTLTGLNASAATANATNFDTETPGNSTFGDEMADGDGDFIGVQIGSDASNVFASLGSVYFTDGAPKEALTITTAPLNTANLTTSISWGGAYDASGNAGSTHGAVAQGGSFDDQVGVSGSAMYTALAGDANLDGNVDLLDLDILGTNFNQSPRGWSQANFNNHLDNVTDLLDLDILGGNFGMSQSAAAVAASVPEPSSMLLLGLLAGGTGLVLRRRS